MQVIVTGSSIERTSIYDEPEVMVEVCLKREVGESIEYLYRTVTNINNKKFISTRDCGKTVCLTHIMEAVFAPKFVIDNVIFNPPATIVFWPNGTKTVVKAQDGDIFDPEKGLAMAISKKALGNKGNYCNELKKWLPKKETLGFCTMSDIEDSLRKLGEAASKIQFPISKPVIDDCKSCDPLCHAKVSDAYQRLVNALHDKKATKAYFEAAMEEAIGYLGEALDD